MAVLQTIRGIKMSVIELNDENWNNEVVESDIPVIIDFYANWCGPCKMMAPIFEEVSDEFEGKLKFGKLDTDKYGRYASDFNISGIPCLVVTKKGEEISRIVGYNPKEALAEKINEILK